jgi:hypothetical protein
MAHGTLPCHALGPWGQRGTLGTWVDGIWAPCCAMSFVLSKSRRLSSFFTLRCLAGLPWGSAVAADGGLCVERAWSLLFYLWWSLPRDGGARQCCLAICPQFLPGVQLSVSDPE